MESLDLLNRMETGALALDESNRGKVEVFGPEAAMFLHNLSTADVSGMPIGAGSEAFFCNARARSVAWGNIYHVVLSQGRDAYWIDLPPGEAPTLMAHLDRHLISEQAEFADRTSGFGQFHLAGAFAKGVLEVVIGDPVPPLENWQHMERSLGGRVVAHVRRRDFFGYEGYDLVFQAKHDQAVREMLVAQGVEWVSRAQMEWARIWAGSPEWGREIGAETFVSELGRNRFAVAATKGCYLGQEPIVMARDRGQITKRLCKLSLSDLPVDLPTGLKKLDKDAGSITSVAEHPREGCMGLGFVRRAYWTQGETLSAGPVDVTCLGPATPE
jgi:folate-binding protein YgfZ